MSTIVEMQDPIGKISYVADEAKKVVEPDIESATESLVEANQYDVAVEKRLLRKIDIWRKYERT